MPQQHMGMALHI